MTQTCQHRSIAENSPCRHYLRSEFKEPGFCTLPSEFRCTEALKKYLPSMSQSALKTFCQCRYKYHSEYIKGIQVHSHAKPLPVKLGTVWDAFVNAWVSGNNLSFEHMESLKDEHQIYNSDMARIYALIRAVGDIGLQFGTGDTQYHMSVEIMGNIVTGYLDIAGFDHFKEVKLSARPEFYTELANIWLQCGTYMLARPDFEYVDILATRLPQLRTGSGRQSDEDPAEFANRIYGDIIKRPAYYFIGYNRKEKTFGKRFWRSEFDLDGLKQTYQMVFKDLRHAIDNDLWYMNTLACHVPTPCWYLPYCKTGVMSDNLYYKEDVNDAKIGMK